MQARQGAAIKLMTLEAYIDGGSRGNPGEAGIGVYFPGVVRIAEYIGTGTNNFAEYSALVTALRFAVCYWHTFRGTGSDPFGSPCRPQGTSPSTTAMAS